MLSFTVAKRENNVNVIAMNQCCYQLLILYIVTVPSVKVIVERGGTYSFITGKQNSNQFMVRSFNIWRYEHKQFDRRDEKPKHQRQFFRNFDNFYI